MDQSVEKHLEPGIKRAETHDDEISRRTKVRVFRWQAWTAAMCLLARPTLLYLLAKYIIDAQQAKSLPVFNSVNFVAWTYFLMELAFFLYRLYPQHLQSIQLGPKARFRPRLRLHGNDHTPTVDVLIFYCGEELDVVLNTTRAACSVDYPPDRFRVTVLDDSASISRPINALQDKFSNLFYSTRGTRQSSWHKAGNINHGLAYVASLSGGPNEFVAGLDVDMIPEPDWLRLLVPHLIQDPTLGLVSPNQRFYNTPPGDPLGQLVQFDQMQQVRNLRKDFGQLSLGGGTGWVARRAAIDDIGGFALDGISEDFLTCIDLKEAGWKVALLDENVQYGIVPDSFNGHVKQYQRWMTAMLSFYRALHGSEKPRQQRAFKIVAQFSTIAYMLGMVICYFGLPLMVLSGQPLIQYSNPDQLKFLLLVAFLDFSAQSLHGLLESLTADSNIYIWHETSHLWHTPYFLPPFLRRFFPTICESVLGKIAALQPGISPANRSSEDRYREPWARLHYLMREGRVAAHVFVLCECVAGLSMFAFSLLAVSRHRHGDGNMSDDNNLLLFIITHLGYPPALFLFLSTLSNSLIPFYYAIFVPPRVPRKSYLTMRLDSLHQEKKKQQGEEEEGAQCFYPKTEAKDQRHRRVREWRLWIVGVYFVAVVAVALSGLESGFGVH